MATQAMLGALTQLKLGDGGTPTEIFTKIAEVLNISEIGSSAPEVDVTNMDSTSVERIAGLPDGAEVNFDMNWVAGNVQQEDLRDSVGTTRNFQCLWPDASQASFALVILGFKRSSNEPTQQLKASLNGRITGDITWL